MDTLPRQLSLYSGLGAGCLGGKILGWRTVCYVERDKFCQQVLQKRIADGWLDDAPIWDDVRSFNGVPWREQVDVLTAGFPCQPFSVAGSHDAGDDHRNLWPTTARIIGEVRPRWILLENVANLATGGHRYWGEILGDLADLGFDVVWDVVRADQCGAPHERRRLWALGVWRWREVVFTGECQPFFPGGERLECRICGEDYVECVHPGPTQDGIEYREFDGTLYGRHAVAHTDGERREKFDPTALTKGLGSHPRETFENGAPARFRDEPRPVGVADGAPDRVDRIRAAGNAQMPQQMALAVALLGGRLRRVLGIENENQRKARP